MLKKFEFEFLATKKLTKSPQGIEIVFPSKIEIFKFVAYPRIAYDGGRDATSVPSSIASWTCLFRWDNSNDCRMRLIYKYLGFNLITHILFKNFLQTVFLK